MESAHFAAYSSFYLDFEIDACVRNQTLIDVWASRVGEGGGKGMQSRDGKVRISKQPMRAQKKSGFYFFQLNSKNDMKKILNKSIWITLNYSNCGGDNWKSI